jgi:hypothetical protein
MQIEFGPQREFSALQNCVPPFALQQNWSNPPQVPQLEPPQVIPFEHTAVGWTHV